MGYQYEPDKLGVAKLTPEESQVVAPPRIRECPVQLEAVLEAAHPIAESDPARKGNLIALEVRIVRVHVEERLLLQGHENRIDPDAWRPLIMSFCQFYGLDAKVHSSRLAEIPESAYRPRPRVAEVVAEGIRS
jgi:flavin reductase (DIM6/NTAB) family NADH-FMN oxidoreductase RutF